MGIKVTYPLGAGRSSEPSTVSHTWTKHWHWGIIHWAVGISEWPPELQIFPQSATGGRWNHPPRPVRTLRHSPWWFSWNTESEFFLQAWNPDFSMKPEKKTVLISIWRTFFWCEVKLDIRKPTKLDGKRLPRGMALFTPANLGSGSRWCRQVGKLDLKAHSLRYPGPLKTLAILCYPPEV